MSPVRFVLVLAVLLPACFISESISTSFNQAMDSMSKSFQSMSNSSGGATDAQISALYQRDVRAYTGLFLASGGSDQDFTRGLTRIAEQHGVTNWEAEPVTMLAVGEGLASSSVEPIEVDRLCAQVGSVDAERARLLLQGYRSADL